MGLFVRRKRTTDAFGEETYEGLLIEKALGVLLAGDDTAELGEKVHHERGAQQRMRDEEAGNAARVAELQPQVHDGVEGHETPVVAHEKRPALGDVFHAFAFDAPVDFAEEFEPGSPGLDVVHVEAPVVVFFFDETGFGTFFRAEELGEGLEGGVFGGPAEFALGALIGDGPVVLEFAQGELIGDTDLGGSSGTEGFLERNDSGAARIEDSDRVGLGGSY